MDARNLRRGDAVCMETPDHKMCGATILAIGPEYALVQCACGAPVRVPWGSDHMWVADPMTLEAFDWIGEDEPLPAGVPERE